MSTQTRLMVLCAAFCLASPALRADTVLFKDDLELSGPKVEVLREYERGVDVKVPHGTTTILWPRIKQITIDYDSHLANIKADARDTPAGLLGFATLLVRHDMNKEAVDICRMILQKDKVAEDILYDVAQMMKKQKEWPIAKTALEIILRVNPSRQDVLRLIDEMAKNIKDGAGAEPTADPTKGTNTTDTKQPVVDPTKGTTPTDTKQPVKEPTKEPPVPRAVEGMEAEDDWVAEAWGNKAEVSIVEQDPKLKNKVLSVVYSATDKDKVAVRLGGTWDLTEREELVFDVWNAADKSIGLSVAFNTMPGWKFYESVGKSISPKQWTTVHVNVAEKRFKCEDSKWRNTSDLVGRDNVKQIILLIYNTGKDGVVYFDNIRFVDKAGAAAAK